MDAPADTEFPHKRTRHGRIVHIYRENISPKDCRKSFQYFTVHWHDENGRRTRRKFRTWEEADSWADRCLENGSDANTALTLRGRDARNYRQAYADYSKLIADGFNVGTFANFVSEACRWTRASKLDVTKQILIEKAVDEFIADKKPHIREKHYIDLRNRLRRLNQSAPVSQLAEVFSELLKTIPPGSRNAHNFRGAIVNFANWCGRKDYLPREYLALTKVVEAMPPYRNEEDVTIYTPDEMSRLLQHASESVLAAIALGGFAGLRTAEIQRLQWQDIRETSIRISKKVAKTVSRAVPLEANLNLWLDRVRQDAGPICQLANLTNAFHRTATKAGIAWKHNALRHSYCSYRLALVGDVWKVATDAGNSATMIRQHYDGVVEKKDAQAWFAISPKSASTPAFEKLRDELATDEGFD